MHIRYGMPVALALGLLATLRSPSMTDGPRRRCSIRPPLRPAIIAPPPRPVRSWRGRNSPICARCNRWRRRSGSRAPMPMGMTGAANAFNAVTGRDLTALPATAALLARVDTRPTRWSIAPRIISAVSARTAPTRRCRIAARARGSTTAIPAVFRPSPGRRLDAGAADAGSRRRDPRPVARTMRGARDLRGPLPLRCRGGPRGSASWSPTGAPRSAPGRSGRGRPR